MPKNKCIYEKRQIEMNNFFFIIVKTLVTIYVHITDNQLFNRKKLY